MREFHLRDIVRARPAFRCRVSGDIIRQDIDDLRGHGQYSESLRAVFK